MEITEYQDLLSSEKVYGPEDIDHVLDLVKPELTKVATHKKKVQYYNIPAAFDIETSSFRDYKGDKCACMYEWTFGILGYVIIGRTWEQYINLISRIVEVLALSPYLRLIVGVHNLAWEFQFIRKRFTWENVFSMDQRKPIYALTEDGIEYRCTYLLSGYSLAKLGENLNTYHIAKMSGDLDYEKIRHYNTPLTPTEIKYCANDVKVVMAYLQEQIDANGNIAKIPITKTGFVRRYCKNNCFYDGGKPSKKGFKRRRYMEIMRGLTLDPEEYKQQARAFQGGFTHTNPFFTGKVVNNVLSIDFTSSYPFVMVAEKFPMSRGELYTPKDFNDFKRMLKLYCCVFDVEFTGLKPKLFFDNYISISHCWNVSKPVTNNGRVVSADHLCTTVTNVDFDIIERFYSWDKISIRDFRRYKKDYLPTDLVKAILKLYQDKTTLKDVAGKEIEYLAGKEMLNSTYGMMVTSIIRPLITYNGQEWGEDLPDINEAISSYNENGSRFLFYPWGVFVTAYARRNLFTGILEFGEDYIYADTDSIKVRNYEKHRAYVEEYNQTVREQLERACRYHRIPFESVEPSTIKGVKKLLGVWDFDGLYQRIKCLGAKRYMVHYADDPRNKEKADKITLTVSGLNKKICIPYLLDKYGTDGIFEHFTDDMYIPPDYTGKNTHTYIDDVRSGMITDYLGVAAAYEELSGVHLEKTDYSLSLAREYIEYFTDIQDTEDI